MIVEKRTHQLWEEYQTIPQEVLDRIKNATGHPFKCPVSKIQYIYSSPKGKISLVHFVKTHSTCFGEPFWEIYSYEKLFSDCERFKTKKDAEKRIQRLL